MATRIIPIVMVQRYDPSLGSWLYTRVVNRAVTHKVQAAVPLEPADVEAFRLDADKVLREQEAGAAA